jgi:hypothetical protein
MAAITLQISYQQERARRRPSLPSSKRADRRRTSASARSLPGSIYPLVATSCQSFELLDAPDASLPQVTLFPTIQALRPRPALTLERTSYDELIATSDPIAAALPGSPLADPIFDSERYRLCAGKEGRAQAGTRRHRLHQRRPAHRHGSSAASATPSSSKATWPARSPSPSTRSRNSAPTASFALLRKDTKTPSPRNVI